MSVIRNLKSGGMLKICYAMIFKVSEPWYVSYCSNKVCIYGRFYHLRHNVFLFSLKELATNGNESGLLKH